MTWNDIKKIPADMDLEQDYIFKEERGIIRDCVEALPEGRDKDILKLKYGFYGVVYTQREIAAMMGVSVSTVKRTTCRVRKALRGDFDRASSDEPKQLKKTNNLKKS